MSDQSRRVLNLSKEKLEKLIQARQQKGAKLQIPRSPERANGNVFALSPGQEGLWFLQQLAPESPFYTVSFALELNGALDVGVLEGALQDLVQHHETLRTRLVSTDKGPVQEVLPDAQLVLSRVDARGLEEAQQRLHVEKLANEDAHTPFDLEKAPLMRATLVEQGPTSHVLLIALHHAISDIWSLRVFGEDLSACYAARRAGSGVRLPELSVQYVDFAHWQREQLAKDGWAKALTWWKKQLEGAPPLLELPADHPRPAQQSFRGAEERVTLSPALTTKLRALAQAEGVSLYVVLLAAFQALLVRYTGRTDLVLGSAVANRSRPGLERLIGFFANVIVLRTDCSGDPPFKALLHRAKEVTLAALANHEVPFERLVTELRPARAAYNPVFQVVFGLDRDASEAVDLAGLKIAPLHMDSGTSKFDLALMMVDSGAIVQGVFQYSLDLFEAATIQRMREHFEVLLAAAVAAPETKVSSLPLMSEQEKVAQMPPPAPSAAPSTPLLASLQAALRESPQAPALIGPGGELSRADLERRARGLCRALEARAATGERVALWTPRGPERLVALLGILEAGAECVPFHEDDAPAWVMEQALKLGVKVVVTDSSRRTQLQNLDCVAVDQTPPSDDATSSAKPAAAASWLLPGSAGLTRVDAAGLSARFAWINDSLSVGTEPVAHRSRIDTVIGLWECLGAVQRGAPAVLADGSTEGAAQGGVWHVAPEEFGALPATGGPKTVFTTQPLSRAQLSLLKSAKAGRAMRALILPPEASSGLVAEASAYVGAGARVLDPSGQPVPARLPGRLWLSGDRPFDTGIAARRLEDGSFEMSAEIREQRWRHGAPVDEAALEQALLKFSDVADCAVRLRGTSSGELRCVAYVVPAKPITSAALREQLASRLGMRLLPDDCVLVSSLPVTPAGTVDEAALAAFVVLDDEVVRRHEEVLSWSDEVDAAAAVIVPRRRDERVHVRDLLGNSGVASAGTNPASVSSGPSSDRPALAHGPQLALASNAASTLGEALLRAAESAQGIRYLPAAGEPVRTSYAELKKDALGVLGVLQAAGLRPKDRALLQLSDTRELVSAIWACFLGGFVPCPVAVPTRFDSADAAAARVLDGWQVLDRPVIVTTAQTAAALRGYAGEMKREEPRLIELGGVPAAQLAAAVPHAASPDDIALILLTSGTTGLPKAAMLRHRNILARSAAEAQTHGITPQDVTLNWFPLDHVVGLVMFHLRDVFLQTEQIHAATSLALEEPLRWMDWVSEYGVTVTWAPNFAYALVNERAHAMAGRTWRLNHLRAILNGAEMVVASTARRFVALLKPFGLAESAMRPGYGMTETSSAITFSLDFSLPGTADSDPAVALGPPMAGVTLRVVDAEGRPLRDGEVGRLQVSGATVFAGYYGNPDATREALSEDGWLTTGDLAALRDGQLIIVGREKELIIINGANHAPQDIEAALQKLPSLAEAQIACFAVRTGGAQTDELAVAFARREQGQEPPVEEIKSEVTKRFGIKPAYVLELRDDELPRTSIGKLQRSELRRRLEAGTYESQLRQMDLSARNENSVPQWAFRPTWRPSPIRHRSANAPRRFWALTSEASRPLVEQLARAGLDVRPLEPGAIDGGSAAAFREALRQVDLQQDGILHLRGYGPSADAGRTAALAWEVATLCQVLGELGGSAQLFVVTTGAQAVEQNELLEPARAAAAALLLTSAAEWPQLLARQIDLRAQSAAADAQVLAEELRSEQKDPEVAWRHAVRWVRALERVDLKAQASQEPWLKQGGRYLITGGVGGVGTQVAENLLSRWQARLLLVGRKAPAEAQLQRLHHLGGEVVFRAVDVCDAEGLRRVVAEAESLWAAPLDGVFHLAGQGRLAALENETADAFAAPFAAKVQGAQSLTTLAASHPEAFFVAFSTVNAFFGGYGAGAYGAANRALEAVWHNLSCSHPKVTTLSWSSWENLGMSRGSDFQAAAQSRGFFTLKPTQAVATLSAALHSPDRHLIIGLDADKPGVAAQVPSESGAAERLRLCYTSKTGREATRLTERPVRDVLGTVTRCEYALMSELPRTADGRISRDELVRKSEGTARNERPHVAPRSPLEKRIAAIWEEVLQLPQVGVKDNFFELGGQSLLAVRMVAMLEQLAGRKLPVAVLLEQPTIEGMVKVVTRQSNAANREIDREAEATLPPEIVPAAMPQEPRRTFNQVFLTGSTGFLGSYLLRELLEQTSARVLCLVRSSSPDNALRKIQKIMTGYGLWKQEYAERIQPVLGDLAQPRLGLTEAHFEALGQQLDALYHNGAWVNVNYPYDELKPTNVLGTQEALRLAVTGGTKPFHYISTMGVFQRTGYDAPTVVDERTPLRPTDLLTESEGYAETKWVAERLVQKAGERGVPVAIYRPGRVTGDSKSGRWTSEDMGFKLLKGCIQLAQAPRIPRLKLDMVPVDYVGRAIIHLSTQPSSLGEVFHLLNPSPIGWEQLTEWMRAWGYSLRSVAVEDWLQTISNIRGTDDNAIAPIVEPVSKSLLDGHFADYHCELTQQALSGSGIECPAITDELLTTYFRGIADQGLIELPTRGAA